MKDYFENPSEFVRNALASRKEREVEFYSIENIKKHWLDDSPQSFIAGMKHEILEEMLGFESWLNVFIDDPALASMRLSKYEHNGEPITVKDICQLMLASVETVKKILELMKKYAEMKFDEESH